MTVAACMSRDSGCDPAKASDLERGSLGRSGKTKAHGKPRDP